MAQNEKPQTKPLLIDPQQTALFLRSLKSGVSQPVQEDLNTIAELIESKRL